MDRKWVIHMASWVVATDRSLVKYADKKFVKVQTEWKSLVTITAVQLYKLAPASANMCHFGPAIVLERINYF
jgi:hypothetical protein